MTQHIQNRIAALTAMSKGIMANLKKRSWRAWAVLAATLFVLQEVIVNVFAGRVTSGLQWVWRGLVWFGSQRMWFAGVLILVYAVILLSAAFWQSRPRRTTATTTPALSETERRLIQDLRTLWNRHGQGPVFAMRSLFDLVVVSLRERLYWSPLLSERVSRLQNSSERFAESVSMNSTQPLRAVRDQFNEMYSAYLDACEWLAKLTASGEVDLSADSYRGRLFAWQVQHGAFFDKIQDLHQQPEHHRTLKVFVEFVEDPAYAAFLRAAEQTYLAVTRRTTGDTLTPSVEPPQS